VATFGPVLLGVLGWQQLSGRTFASWSSFKRIVEELFGQTEEQLEEAFFSLRPNVGETSARFVLRVEMERKRLGIDPKATYHAFKEMLDMPTRQVLDVVRINKKVAGSMISQAAKFGWDDVVMVFRDRLSGVSMVAEAPPKERPQP
jgi:hypothetical protein